MSTADSQTNPEIAEAGQLHVVQELLDRGLLVEPRPAEPRGTHYRFRNPAGTWHANLQIRASGKKVKLWIIGDSIKDFTGPDCFYVFLRWDPDDADYEVFLESAEVVASESEAAQQASLERGNKKFPPWWELPEDEESQQRLRERWQWFGREGP